MSAAIADEQQALLHMVLSPSAKNTTEFIANYIDPAWAQAQRGLKTYRANGQALAERALGAAYPVVAQLLGAASFAALARAFWHRRPPQRGDMAHWGASLSCFMAADPQLAGEPYLPDVARAEWALHTAASAADRPAVPATWARLASHDPAALTLGLAPGTAQIDSAWPVYTLLAAHDGRATLGDAARCLRDGVAECALVWRDGLRPRVRATQPGEAAFVGALLQGATLAAALAHADESARERVSALAGAPARASEAAFDFASWLPAAALSGLLVSVGWAAFPSTPGETAS
jgi:Putative DNA-binding domain